jgi:hypothetical protein
MHKFQKSSNSESYTQSSESSGFYRLRVFENRLLSRMFGLDRHKVTGGWRKLHNEELRGLYS